MIFNKHSNLNGVHATLSPSHYHWINYDDNRLAEYFLNIKASEMGTRLHAFAKECIELGVKLPRNSKTLNMYVNDAIGYGMIPEQVLYYSDRCFGTADTISFKHNLLRIHDYKSGSTKASFHQLEIYAAIFCLEYHIDPYKIEIELRLYQSDERLSYTPNPEDIDHIMQVIIDFDKKLEAIEMEV